MTDYDVIVIGGGSPGEHCVGALVEGGLRVALVERELVGGECSYWACIPSKTLLRPGEAAHAANEAAARATVDVEAALAWRDFMVSAYSDSGQERWLAGQRVDLLRGHGRLAGPGVVEVDGTSYTADHVVLANGADPFVPPVPGLRDLDGVWTNREVTGMKAVPRRLLVLGGGPVGVEMAQAVRRFGGAVTVVEQAEHLLSHEPRPLGEALADVLSQEGVELALGAEATSARMDGDEYVVELVDGHELRADRILVATGRRPRVQDLGLDTVGVDADPHGVLVDASLRAGEGLWAIGDVTGIWQLTHVGKYQGEVVASNILGEPREANYDAVPRVVFTDPQAASVGSNEGTFSSTVKLAEIAKTETYTHAYASSNGFLTLLSDGERLTGAHAFGPEAGEWLQQATLAIRARVSVDVLRDTIQPFPTFSEIYVGAVNGLRRDQSQHAARRATKRRAVSQVPELVGQRVVVIGGTSGIGLEAARRAKAEGADVIVAARNPDRLHDIEVELDATTAAFDALDFDRLGRFFDELPAAVDHVLVTGPGPYYAPLADFDFDKGRRDVEAHVWLPMQVARNSVGRVRAGGTLLFIGGTGGRRQGPGLSLITALTAAGPALIKNLAVELAPIRVNLIAAGFVDTPLSASLLGDQIEERREQLRRTLPIGRVVGPADIAAVAVHLMTNTAVTGATYDIDGGQQLVNG